MDHYTSNSIWKRRLAHTNWPLVFGILIVALLALAAFMGPWLAPNDPMQETYALRVDGKIIAPPYSAFTFKEFPLGSDRFGRDLFSRLLWAIRPTLSMVVAVAAVRLGLGLLIGLVSGWSRGPAGRFLESLTTITLSIPVLFVAMAGITAVGIERGLAAFVIGLSLTGWADTAQVVAGGTRQIREQTFIEAARALGASDASLLYRHVLRQVLPMVWMLLAFEISGTLLVAAQLGFLGYYIGGGMWIEVFDFQSVNVTGLPELGQMLATSLVTLTQPWALLAVSLIVFLAVLGFNLLGIGLRHQLSPELAARQTIFRAAARQVSYWFEEKLSPALATPTGRRVVRGLMAGGVVLVIGAVIAFWPSQTSSQQGVVAVEITVPGGHFWASERHDAQGTRSTDAVGPRNPRILWELDSGAGFRGGPAVAADGTVYIGASNGNFFAVTPAGELAWQARLPEGAIGAPAIDAQGNVYAVDLAGGLTALTSSGDILWRFESGGVPTTGPIIAPDGTLYFALGEYIQAVSASGQGLWMEPVTSSYVEMAPRLSPTGELVYLKDGAADAKTGARQDIQVPTGEENMFGEPNFLVGANGLDYYRFAHAMIQWKQTAAGAESLSRVTWETRGATPVLPADSGVTFDGRVWFLYAPEWRLTSLVWVDGTGRFISNDEHRITTGYMIGVDREGTAYLCGTVGYVECMGLQPGRGDPLWTVLHKAEGTVVGGAVVPGRVYFATLEGILVAVGD